MIVLIDTNDGRHFETLVKNGNFPLTLPRYIQIIADYGFIKVTTVEGDDLKIPLEEIRRIGLSTDPADGVRQ